MLDAEVTAKTQAAIMEALPAAAAKARYQLSVEWPVEERQGINQVRLWIAAYDRQRARPAVYSLFADAMEGEAAADAYKVREIAGHMTPALAPEALQAALPHGSVTEPRSDVVRLLRGQRQVKFDHVGGNGCGMGGECEFYTVDRRGITVERVLRFNDAVGCIPDPTDPGEPMAKAYRFPCDGSPAVQMT